MQTNVQFEVGKYYQCKEGETFLVKELDSKEFRFVVLNPRTFEETDFRLEGEVSKLDDFAKAQEVVCVAKEDLKPKGSLATKKGKDVSN